MRVNVYAEEMTDRVEIVSKEIDGKTFTGLRFWLAFPGPDGKSQFFEHRPGDDDSSAVTFWGKRDLRATLRQALDLLDEHYRNYPIDRGYGE
jgi:hypothetical protein